MSFADELRSDLGGIRVPDSVVPPADLADTVLVEMRRQARRRAAVAAGGLAVAVAVGGATAPVWLSPQPGSGPAAPTTTRPACDGPLPTRPPSSTWEYFDPLTYEVDANGVTGYQVRGVMMSTYYQVMALINPGGDRSVGVLLYAAGGKPHYIDAGGQAVPFDPSSGEPAGPIGGAPAYWQSADRLGGDTNRQGLAWEWTPGAWVLVFADDTAPEGELPAMPPADPTSTVDPEELQAIALQVAPQIELGVGTPVTSPFSMSVPDCTRLAITNIETAGDGEPYSLFLLGFDTADRADSTYPSPGDIQPSLAVMVHTAEAPEDVSGLTEYPEDLGYPAYHSDGVLSVYDVFGFAVNIGPLSMPGVTTGDEKASLAADIFRTMTFYPAAADGEENWGDPIVP